MQAMQLHETPLHVFLKSLKALRFSAVLILTGRVFLHFWSVERKAFSTKRKLVFPRNIQLQLHHSFQIFLS